MTPIQCSLLSQKCVDGAIGRTYRSIPRYRIEDFGQSAKSLNAGDIDKAAFAGAEPPAGLSAEEQHAWDQLTFFYKKGLGYANEMALHPQTLYGLADSPVSGRWILDHDAASQALIARVFAGQQEGLTRDDVLDNITLY
jgi:hypothetical protein